MHAEQASNWNVSVSNLACADRFLAFCMSRLLTASVLLYTVFYDRCEHNYISRIYQHDKYGIVFLYAIVVAYFCWFIDHFLQGHVMVFHNENLVRMYHGQPLHLVDELGIINRVGSIRTTLVAVAALKVVAFTLIFKNNTSDGISDCCLSSGLRSAADALHWTINLCVAGFEAQLIEVTYL